MTEFYRTKYRSFRHQSLGLLLNMRSTWLCGFFSVTMRFLLSILGSFWSWSFVSLLLTPILVTVELPEVLLPLVEEIWILDDVLLDNEGHLVPPALTLVFVDEARIDLVPDVVIVLDVLEGEARVSHVQGQVFHKHVAVADESFGKLLLDLYDVRPQLPPLLRPTEAFDPMPVRDGDFLLGFPRRCKPQSATPRSQRGVPQSRRRP